MRRLSLLVTTALTLFCTIALGRPTPSGSGPGDVAKDGFAPFTPEENRRFGRSMDRVRKKLGLDDVKEEDPDEEVLQREMEFLDCLEDEVSLIKGGF